MTVSHAKGLFGFSLAILGGLAGAVPPHAAAVASDSTYLAQQVEDSARPRRLTPRRAVIQDEPPQPATPQTPPGAPVGVNPPAQAPNNETLDDIVKSNPLAAPDPQSVGVLEEINGGFPPTMWDGSPREFIERLVPQLPDRLQSPTLRRLAQRLLMSAAFVPSFQSEPGEQKSLLAKRVEKLHKLGMLGGAWELISAAPTRDNDPMLLRLKVENLLIRDDRGEACTETVRQRQRLQETFWQERLVFCQILNGERADAALGANLLAEAAERPDPVFFTLVDILTGNTRSAPDSLLDPSPLVLSMLRTANLPVPADALGTASSPLLRMIAISPNADLNIRLEAAERAARFGGISPERLAQVYAGAAFEKTDLDNALTVAQSDRTPKGRALLYQAGIAQSVPAARAEVLKAVFDLARDGGHTALAARVHEPMLHTVAPAAELIWFAPTAARVLYSLGRPVPARSWIAALRQQDLRDETVQAKIDSLWLLARLAGDGDHWDIGEASELRWRQTIVDGDPAAASGKIASAYILFDALDQPLSDKGWQRQLQSLQQQNVVMPDPLFRYALIKAAESRRLAETVLLALIVMGEDGPVGSDVNVVRDVVMALREVGLDAEARAIALEKAVAIGL